jgi:hypothetical protein
MKSLGLGSKNMLFVFLISCLFTFHKHKQRQEVTRPREIATDSTFLTGLFCLHFLNINNDLYTFWKSAKRSSLWVSNDIFFSAKRIDFQEDSLIWLEIWCWFKFFGGFFSIWVLFLVFHMHFPKFFEVLKPFIAMYFDITNNCVSSNGNQCFLVAQCWIIKKE